MHTQQKYISHTQMTPSLSHTQMHAFTHLHTPEGMSFHVTPFLSRWLKVKCHHSASRGWMGMARVCNEWVQGPFPLSLSNVGIGRVKDACSLSLWIISEGRDSLGHRWLFNRVTSWEISSLEMGYFIVCMFTSCVCFSNEWMESSDIGLLNLFAV